MLSMGLKRWYINITITILGIILRTVFYLKHHVSVDVLNKGMLIRYIGLSVPHWKLMLSMGL
jgi:hypothetical protein